MNKPTYTYAECCGTCQWFERHEETDISWTGCTRDEEVDESTTEIMVCEAYMRNMSLPKEA